MNRIRLLVAIMYIMYLMIIISLTGCVHEPIIPREEVNPTPEPPAEEECSDDIIYFQNQVLPILVSNCAKSGCHDATTATEGIILDSYDNIMFSNLIEESNAGDSELYEIITEDDMDDIMPPPPATPLTNGQISIIRDWINQGAVDNNCANTVCNLNNVTYTASIKPIIVNKCQGCHSGTSAPKNIDLTTFTGLKSIVESGQLVGAVSQINGFDAMPLGSKLPQCEIDMIKRWVEGGALEN